MLVCEEILVWRADSGEEADGVGGKRASADL